MIKNYTLPSPLLREYIDRYWFWDSGTDQNITLPKIYPGSGTELIFHFKTPFKGYSTSHILCPRERDKYPLEQSKEVGFISVRFKSWSFRYFSNIPTPQLANRVVTAQEIWGKSGKMIEERIKSSRDFLEMKNFLDNFFEKQLIAGLNQNREIDWAINYIYYNYNTISSLDSIVEDTNLSTRTFQRRIKDSVGVSPKRFLKISRFQTVLKQALLTKSYPGMDPILSAGYYDQSHFNKDFKSLTGYNPTEIISNKNYLSHFYNTSIKK